MALFRQKQGLISCSFHDYFIHHISRFFFASSCLKFTVLLTNKLQAAKSKKNIWKTSHNSRSPNKVTYVIRYDATPKYDSEEAEREGEVKKKEVSIDDRHMIRIFSQLRFRLLYSTRCKWVVIKDLFSVQPSVISAFEFSSTYFYKGLKSSFVHLDKHVIQLIAICSSIHDLFLSELVSPSEKNLLLKYLLAALKIEINYDNFPSAKRWWQPSRRISLRDPLDDNKNYHKKPILLHDIK